MLTASRLRDARACQRRHKHKYIDGYRPLDDAAPLRFGTLFHAALASWWGYAPEFRLEFALAETLEASDPYEAAMARALIVGYDARWSDDRYEVLAVEREFRVPLVNPETGAKSRTWDLGGKLDAVVTGAVVEHKTTSEDIAPGSEYWKRLRLDGQVSIYFQGARAAGFNVERCIYDVIRKPGQRPLKATPEDKRQYKKDGTPYATTRLTDETPEQYEARLMEAIAADPSRHFARGEVVRLDREMDEAMFDAWTIAQQLRAAEVADRFPRNVDACVQYGRTCAFFGVCTGEQSLDDPLLFKRVENVHPELSQVTNLTAEREG